MMRIKSKTNPYRLILQLLMLAGIAGLIIITFTGKKSPADFEAYCPFGGIMAYTSFLVNRSLACSMTSVQIAMGAALVLGILFFSKLFCSLLCPLGTISEWIGKAGERVKLRFTPSGYADLLLRGIKYAILFITIYFSVISSELFCRKFDPYYAAVTGFGSDVAPLLASIALFLLIAGSFFIRLFWCKYICPLGALSNIFRFFITFVIVTGGYIAFRVAGFEIDFVWPVAITCIAAFLLEFYQLKSSFIPLFRIRRHEDVCTNCKLCTRHCPQAIDVASMKDVRHIDCHMCGDCIHVCPEKGALTIDRKGKKWLPAAVTIGLIVAGLLFGRSFEIPTLSTFWGDESLKGETETYTRSGLTNVKCYGTSTAFANLMKKVPGVAGVTTYAGSHTVEILFLPAVTDTTSIRKAIDATLPSVRE